MRSSQRPQSWAMWASVAVSSIAMTHGRRPSQFPRDFGRLRVEQAIAGEGQAGQERVVRQHGVGQPIDEAQLAAAVEPYRIDGQAALGLARLVDRMVGQVIWISFCRRRQSRARAPACSQISILRPVGAYRGGGFQLAECVVGHIPAGGVGRVQRNAGLTEQVVDGAAQRGRLVGADLELVRMHQHEVIPRGVDMDRLEARPALVAVLLADQFGGGRRLGGVRLAARGTLPQVGQTHKRRSRHPAGVQAGPSGQPALLRQGAQERVVVDLARARGGAGEQLSERRQLQLPQQRAGDDVVRGVVAGARRDGKGHNQGQVRHHGCRDCKLPAGRRQFSVTPGADGPPARLQNNRTPLELSLRVADRLAIHPRKQARQPQHVHFVHFHDLDAWHRPRCGGADRRAVGHERLPEGSAGPHAVGSRPYRGHRPGAASPDWHKTAAEAMRNRGSGGGGALRGRTGQLLTREDTVRGVLLRGVDPAEEPKVSDVGNQFRAGSMNALVPGGFGIALGNELANAMGVRVGDKVTLVAPQGTITPAGVLPRLKQFTVVGVFSSGHYEFDSALALIDIEDAETLFRQSGPTGVRLKLSDMQRAPQVAQELAGTMSGELYLRDWSKQNRNWFAAVQTEKRMMFIILTLIIAVAAFNLVSTLVMTVTDKQADIAILRTMGAQPRSIMKIFIVQGVAIGFIGTVLGVLGGTLIATNIDVIVPFIERVLHVQFLPRDIYFISELPSDPRVNDIATIGIISFVLAILATIYPSWRAARVNPAEALRYE